MMRKHVSRLLALVLVLCMVVMCVPVRAHAEVNLTRPENITDEEWEILRKKLLAQLAAEQAADMKPEALPETDSLSKSDSGNLTVTDTAKTTGSADTNQTVSVELPPQADTITTTTDDDNKTTITNEYDTTITVNGEEKNVTVEESYDLNATVKDTETVGDGENKEVTDITYDVSLNGSISAEKKAEETTEKVVENTVIPNVDAAANKAAEEETVPAPQYKVDMTINGMDDKKVTRVEHKYTTTKKVIGSNGSAEEQSVEETEYYYNAANGIDETDTSKKYFTVSEVEKKTETSGVVSVVKEKVVSLWTSFLGIFHITTDAFEGANKATYGSLTEAAAADANTGKTVEMLRDYETNATADLDKKVTVDLNGHDYTNTGDEEAMNVTGGDVTVKNGNIISNGAGAEVSGSGTKFSLKNIFLRSNANNDALGKSAAVSISGSGNTVDVDDSHIDGNRSTYGIQDTSTGKNTVNIDDSIIQGKTSVALKNTDADIRDSYLRSTTGAALSVDGNSKENEVVITNGRFESGKAAANIYAKDKDDIASITVKGGRFTDPTGLCSYVPYGYAAICRNDGSYFLYEVVSTDYTPTREGYRFLGYTDGNGNAISLAEAYRKGVIAYAQWKEIPETTAKPAALITAKTDETGCTTKVTYKGDTAFVTVKDKDGDFAPISEVTIPSVKRLQNKDIDTVEIQVDEDVALVLDIEKAKENGFTDMVEVTLEKDILLITSGKDTCIELDIAELKAADKPVEIQLVEGELSVLLGKNSTMSVDLTKALKTGERIVVKLENGVLKLYDKYHKPIKD
ncbi:MAG: hypothetical protein MSH58_00520 [Clostridiales bacterium]|nr:hypothetical protein [Clostridiales bacterium]